MFYELHDRIIPKADYRRNTLNFCSVVIYAIEFPKPSLELEGQIAQFKLRESLAVNLIFSSQFVTQCHQHSDDMNNKIKSNDILTTYQPADLTCHTIMSIATVRARRSFDRRSKIFYHIV